ncbi:MAG: aminodeoxychorismate synthase, component I [Micavibrio aeruginosavorus]|uniref:Aminodeoxychorismate synthase, component I n=1 Tax=Micavibrio aeruginosavorus TaxID=349221 RepID=A0A2W5N396_9BACT|nr:MAG: aminodeoxychorismate synthase, component I [Micavibrio aeruginosavorus]
MFVYPWSGPDAVRSFAPLAAQPYALFFDSSRDGHPLSRVSYLCWHPFETIESKDGRITITNKDHQFTYQGDAFKVVKERLALWGDAVKTKPDLPAFQGGAAGFFGYDLARALERLPSKAKPHSQPDLCIGLYDKVLAFDHARGEAVLMIHAENEADALKHKAYIEWITIHDVPVFSGAAIDWRSEKSDADYKADIARVIEYIYAGDIFQANLSRRFSGVLPEEFDPYAHYVHLRRINGAPYGAYMNFGVATLASSSPERFLEVKNRIVETRPIKGTHVNAAALEKSGKDRAENIMIVDLLRNDLSKVCEDHSVEVADLCKIESFEGLHHMVSTVRGRLRGNESALDALRACFPGGSITGAPKIRAMQIIDELEPHRRSAYCGAIGWAGFDGAMDTAITIRTLVYENGLVHLQTGGGITAQSDPAAELEETLVKAAKMFESFEISGALKKTA